jgi:hypothetical protein
MPIYQPPGLPVDGPTKWAAVQRIAGELEDAQVAVAYGRVSIIDARPGVIGKLMAIQILTNNNQFKLVDKLSVWVMQEWAMSVRKGDGLEEEWRLLLGELKEQSDYP